MEIANYCEVFMPTNYTAWAKRLKELKEQICKNLQFTWQYNYGYEQAKILKELLEKKNEQNKYY
jgi:hypothetical protein